MILGCITVYIVLHINHSLSRGEAYCTIAFSQIGHLVGTGYFNIYVEIDVQTGLQQAREHKHISMSGLIETAEQNDDRQNLQGCSSLDCLTVAAGSRLKVRPS